MLETIHEPEVDATPGISVVIPVLDGGADLVRLFDELNAQEVPDGMEILVVDSGSRDGSVDHAIAAGARVFRTRSFGHGRTRNEAAALARAPLVVLMTQDAWPRTSQFLTTLAHPLVEDDRLAGAWARQVPRSGTDPLVKATLRRWCPPGEDRLQRALTRAAFDAMTPAERAACCRFDNVASCVRRAVWREHPFPDVPFGEDTAWAKRVLLAGHDLLYRAEAEVTHAHETGLTDTFRRDRLAHELLAREFGLRTVRGPAALGMAWIAGWGSDLRDLRTEGTGLVGTARGLARGSWRRIGSLTGQYAGGRAGAL